MGARKTSIAIDQELAAAAMKVLGTTSLQETVEGALREVLKVQARRDEVAALGRTRGMDLDKPDVMARAWRR